MVKHYGKEITKLLASLFIPMLLVVVAIYPRIWNLKTSPPTIVDEPANIRDIKLILKNGLNITDFHWDFSKSRAVHFLPVLLIESGIKDENLALRYSSVLLSLAALIPFYFLAKTLSAPIIAASSTLLFSFSYYYLQFSRVGWTDVILNITLGLFLFLIIASDTKKKNIKKTLLESLVATFIFYSYRSGIIIILVAFTTFVAKSLINSGFKNTIVKMIVFTFMFLFLSLPWINTIRKNPDKYNLRLHVVSINSIVIPSSEYSSKKELYYSQISKVINSWVLLKPLKMAGSESPRYLPEGYPVVNILVKIFFWVGLILSFFKIRQTYPIITIYLLGLLGQIVTINPPNGARGLIILPCMYLFLAIGMQKAYDLTSKKPYLLALILFFSIVFSVIDFYFYQYWMAWIKV